MQIKSSGVVMVRVGGLENFRLKMLEITCEGFHVF